MLLQTVTVLNINGFKQFKYGYVLIATLHLPCVGSFIGRSGFPFSAQSKKQNRTEVTNIQYGERIGNVYGLFNVLPQNVFN